MKLLARPQLVILGTLVAIAALLPFAGCDKATPVAPSGTTLAIVASPPTVGLTGTSTVTVIGRRPNGSPLIPGTEIQFSTSLGTISPTLATTNSAGEATATFRADGRPGAATITASTSSSTSTPTPTPTPTPPPPTTGASVSLITGEAGGVSVTTTIQVGESAATTPTLLVSVNPSTIPVKGLATVTVIARNADNSPAAAGREVLLTTTLGSLDPQRPVTKADGTATSTLTAGTQSGKAIVTAILGSSKEVTAEVTIRDAASDMVLDPQSTTIQSTGGDITFTVFVTNTQGEPFQGATVTFSIDGASGTYEGNTNIAITDTSGSAKKKITFSPTDLSGIAVFHVTASTPGPTGQLISRTATVTVR